MLIVKNWKKLHQRSETSLISLCELRSSESISPSSLARALIYGIVIYFNAHQFSSVQFSSSVVSNSMRPHESQHARHPCPSPTLRVSQNHVHRVSDGIQPFHPLLSPSPPPHNPSQHQSHFQWVNSSHRWPKYWSFSFSIIPSKEIPGLISFRMDWLDLLAVQRTLKSLLQHHSSKPSILGRSAFFTVQLSYPYMTLEIP